MKRKKLNLSAAPIECEYRNPAAFPGMYQVLRLLDDFRCTVKVIEDTPKVLFCQGCGQIWHMGFGNPPNTCDFCNRGTSWNETPPEYATYDIHQSSLF